MKNREKIPGISFLNIFCFWRDPTISLENLFMRMSVSEVVRKAFLPHVSYTIGRKPEKRIQIECYVGEVTNSLSLDLLQKRIQKYGFFDLPLAAVIEANTQNHFLLSTPIAALGSSWKHVPERVNPKDPTQIHSFIPLVIGTKEIFQKELKADIVEKGSIFMMQKMTQPSFT